MTVAASRIQGVSLLFVCIATSTLLCGCGDPTATSSTPDASFGSTREAAAVEPPPDLDAVFVDVARSVGVDFQYDPGSTGKYYFCEIVGAGAGLFDYDNDGDLDLYLTQGHALPEAAEGPAALRDRLFRNDLTRADDGSISVQFVDVTDESQIRATGYGMGVVAGDVDNDGNIDLYVTNFGSNQLWKNNGDGTFTDVTAAANVDDSRWSTSAAFLDYDRDGWLDLFVANYVSFDLGSNKRCVDPSGYDDYCGPQSYDAVPDRLFHNNGDGTFTDVSSKSQIASAYGAGLGVVATDANLDGWLDIYVANDQDENELWINDEGKRFRNTAMIAGCALNSDGKAESGMGVDAGDFDGDGDEDIFVTHLATETNTLYVSDCAGGFEDATRIASLGLPSWKFTGFGTGFIDYDNDSWLDLFIANGAVTAVEGIDRDQHDFPYQQRNLLFRNVAGSRFENVSDLSGAAMAMAEVSRGTAFGDIDNDGDLDLVVANIWAPTRVLMNRSGSKTNWVGLRAYGNGRDQLGARVELLLGGGRRIVRTVRTDGSYISSRDPRVLCGLGTAERVDNVRVYWPNGFTEDFGRVPIKSWTTLTLGAGKRVE